jgi:hypothetical protein
MRCNYAMSHNISTVITITLIVLDPVMLYRAVLFSDMLVFPSYSNYTVIIQCSRERDRANKGLQTVESECDSIRLCGAEVGCSRRIQLYRNTHSSNSVYSANGVSEYDCSI